MTTLTDAEYRAIPALSGSAISDLLRSPAVYRWRMDHPTPSSPAQALGALIHAFVLGQEPPAIVSPYDDFRTKEAREWRDSQVLEVVKADVWDLAVNVAAAILDHPAAAKILAAPGKSEVAVSGEHRGYALKGRIDRLPDVGPIVDVKTARDVMPDAMSRFMADYGTATQLAHYALITGRESERPIIIAADTTEPHLVAVYRIGEFTWQVALNATRRAWDIYADCMESGVWPSGLSDDITDLEMKPWALDELDPLSAEIEV
mgnify:CR=1 FL=1